MIICDYLYSSKPQVLIFTRLDLSSVAKTPIRDLLVDSFMASTPAETSVEKRSLNTIKPSSTDIQLEKLSAFADNDPFSVADTLHLSTVRQDDLFETSFGKDAREAKYGLNPAFKSQSWPKEDIGSGDEDEESMSADDVLSLKIIPIPIEFVCPLNDFYFF